MSSLYSLSADSAPAHVYHVGDQQPPSNVFSVDDLNGSDFAMEINMTTGEENHKYAQLQIMCSSPAAMAPLGRSNESNRSPFSPLSSFLPVISSLAGPRLFY